MKTEERLFTPGPTQIPQRILRAVSQPLIHHRSEEFKELFREIREKLKYPFQTRNDILIWASSGTGAMEATVSNLFSPGERVLVIEGGKFGRRWVKISKAFGLDVVEFRVKLGEAADPEEVGRVVAKEKGIVGVLATLCETSTGVVEDIQGLGRALKGSAALLIVDAVSGLAVDELRSDEWGVDVVVSASQKGLMLPPGLAFLSLSPRAWERAEKSSSPRFYWDLREYREFAQRGLTPYTPAISLLFGLKEVLSMIEEEGVEGIWARHRRLAQATRKGIEALGLELFSHCPSNGVTAVRIPSGLDGDKLLGILRSDFGVVLAHGQEELKGRIFRLAHMGWVEGGDILRVMGALELALRELDFGISVGKGTGAAMDQLMGEKG